ncbi:MAG TPA: hypothetical protein VMI72_12700 [Roseiarcus sp.]|nr:hypothetical protein [Roseiarcus sp.]
MRRFASDLLARAALLLLIAAAILWPAQAQIGPAPGGGGAPAGSSGQIQYNNSGAFGGRAPSGNGSTVVTTTGTLTSGDCVKIDANGNMIDAGGACGGASGVSSLTTACPAGLSGATGAVTMTGSIPTNAQTGASYTIQSSDCGKLLTIANAGAVAVTLPQAGTSGFLTGFFLASVQNLGPGVATIAPTVSTINGAASLTLNAGQSASVISDGANYFAQVTRVPGGSSGQVQYNNGGNFSGYAKSGNGTTIASTSGSLTNNHCVSIDASGNLVDSGAGCGGAPGGSSGQIQYNNSGSFGGYAKSGNGTTIASTSGALTNGDCIKIDASGNLVDSGGACGGSGSPGGSNGQIQYNNSGSFGGLPIVGSGSSVVEANSVSGNSGKVAQSSGTLTGGDCAGFDANANLVDAGAGPCQGDNRPGLIAGSVAYYPLNPPGTGIAASTTAVVGVTYCAPFVVNKTITFDQMIAGAQTAGSSNAHAAVYANAYDSSSHHYYPSGSPLASDNNSPANSTTMTFTFASNVQLTPGTYWACFQANDTIGKVYAIAGTTTTPYSYIVGAGGATGASGLPTTGIKSSVGTFGAWPNSPNWTGNGWTEFSQATLPAFAIRLVSTP